MKGITWSRDSHGLFDYESRHLTKNTMKANQESQVLRVDQNVKLVPLKDAPQNADSFHQAASNQED